MPDLPDPPELPTVAELVADLRVLRERGLVRLRHSDLGALRRAADHATVAASASTGSGAVEALLRAAVENLGGGSLGPAAACTFGLGRGARDRAAADRRRQAALVYGVSIERFRKHQERAVLEQVAEEILKLCQPPQQVPDIPSGDLRRQLALAGSIGGIRFPVTVHTEPVEFLCGADVIVVPLNVYLELPQHYKSSVAGAARRAAARRGADGEIVADVVSDELSSWLAKNARPGLPVAAGTIVATSPGEMTGRGIRRLYHAALTSPRPGTNSYVVEPVAVARVTENVLALARTERDQFEPPLASVAFPLLGAGRGGLPMETSFAWMWAAIERDFLRHGPWELHFFAHRQAAADLIINELIKTGAVPPPPGWPKS